jgi:N-methylhydantoinase B/oxoprolinase/acetone carboxylase alpha subunit
VSGRIVPGKTRFQVEKNTRLRIESPGGGGWGAA